MDDTALRPQPHCVSAVHLSASAAASSPACTIAHLHVPVLRSCCVPQGRPTQGLLVILHRHCLSCVPCLQTVSALVTCVRSGCCQLPNESVAAGSAA